MELTRERDIYIITLDNGKNIKYDYTKRICYGVSGKVLKQKRSEFKFVDSLYACPETKELCDRLISKGGVNPERFIEFFNNLYGYGAILELSAILNNKQTWKKFLPFITNWINEGNSSSLNTTINQFKVDVSVDELKCDPLLAEALKRKSFSPTFQNAICKALFQANIKVWTTVATTLKNATGPASVKDKDIVEALYFLIGDSVYCIRDIDVCLTQYPDIHIDTRQSVHEICKDVKKQAKNLEFKEASEKFGKMQKGGNLFYENDCYRINIPTTYADCLEIGKYFHNCAGGYEWNSYLANGSRYLVTVVDKRTDEQVVCCDICTKSRNIAQYLGKYNNGITKMSLKQFAKEYQAYLKEG